ncbi:MAG TPA: fumarylacetoacetate hydrolase family protein, partial [Marmoricola sp.]|nr:fumarylacetoacetate hydrolase family protein [Marmoricola sp.]
MGTTNSWVDGAAGSSYDVDNLPYGVFSQGDEPPRVGVRIGDHVLDVAPVAAGEMLESAHVFEAPSLDPLLALGRRSWESMRAWLTQLLTEEAERDLVEPNLVPVADVQMQMPFQVADYVDFYCSLQHATNVGRIFRPDQEPLKPNWRHLPVGYHGRAGTVVVSGTPVRRPSGQRLPAGADAPAYGASERLDIEAELGFVVGTASPLGDRVPTSAFADHVFGVTLLNDWSARDIQSWEYVPLGPFLGKSFATTVSG